MTTLNVDGPVAPTGYGAVLGYQDRGVKVFKGVPYGAPTGGAGRFKPPARDPHPDLRKAVADLKAGTGLS